MFCPPELPYAEKRIWRKAKWGEGGAEVCPLKIVPALNMTVLYLKKNTRNESQGRFLSEQLTTQEQINATVSVPLFKNE